MSRIIKVWPWLLLLAVAVSGCRTEKDYQVHTEYRTVYQRDSVYVDCTDTLYVIQKGDTVHLLEKQFFREYRYQLLHDTLRQCDTVEVEVRTAAAADNPQPCRRWRWFFAGAICSVFCIFAVRIIIRIYLHK